jgi:hypothetical protein
MKQAVHFQCVYAVLILCCSSLGAQPTARPMPTAAPAWPGDGSLSSLDPKQSVFYDIPAAQVVILTRDASGNVLAVKRRDVPNRAAPSVAYTVQGAPGGLLQYRYIITDPASAQQRTRRISILLPSHDSGLSAIGWPTTFVGTPFPDRSATVAFATMRNVVFEDPSSGSAKVQGLQLRLQSGYLPGLGEATVEGQVANPITSSDFSGVDKSVETALSGFLEPGLGSTRYTVLAPLFRPDTSKVAIASNFHYGISVLQTQGRLDASSAYVSQLLAALRGLLEASGAVAFPAVSAPPATPLEREIQNAIAIALQ